jgi:hypothetical protein
MANFKPPRKSAAGGKEGRKQASFCSSYPPPLSHLSSSVGWWEFLMMALSFTLYLWRGKRLWEKKPRDPRI